MQIIFLNPQGNFDPQDSYWTEHPDFGGQLVYVKETALALAELGHRVDIVTRQISDPAWPEFSAPLDAYPGHPRVRIVRIPCGPPGFLPKEALWPYLGTDWLRGILDFYQQGGSSPDVVTAHYADGGLTAALLQRETGLPFTWTAHSLGAQKMDKLQVNRENLAAMDQRFHFARRLMAERVAMSHAAGLITSTHQEQQDQYGHRAYHGALRSRSRSGPRWAVIPPGVNRRVFSTEPHELDALLRRRIEAALTRDLAPERRELPWVICSSRLDRKKNHLGLVKAFAQNEKLRATANLAVAVRGAENPLRERSQFEGEAGVILAEIAALLDEHALWPVVTSFPLNDQAELAAAYRLAARRRSVFALTALYEPFGLAPLEAMSCGLPAVVTRNGGPAESLSDRRTGGEYGLLVDPTDPSEIARALLVLLSSPAKWQRYRQAGIERVANRYTWESTAKGYMSLLTELRAPQSPAAPGGLPIPDYFTQPTPDNDIALEELAALYFGPDDSYETIPDRRSR
ncbi:MAG TPA: glycosyltransferase family 1 protein [Candidatus Fraserbacteria bacterium]|nr:glycosyltransferase family 1 protein [Candidatus Fraserbacteria bacterium]